jgi:hypothetical protein
MINPKKTGALFLRDYTDPDTGEMREFLDANGNPRVKKYTSAKTVLRLSNGDDLLEYLHIKDHPVYIKGSSPRMKLIDVTQEALDSVSHRELAMDAMMEARKLRGEKLADFARVLGIKADNVLETVVKDKLYTYAETNPTEFMEALNDPHRPLRQLLHKGKTVGTLKVDKGGIWKYRDLILGTSIEEAILWLKDNEDLQPKLRKEINSLK